MKKSVIVVVCLLLVGIFGWSIAKANSADIKVHLGAGTIVMDQQELVLTPDEAIMVQEDTVYLPLRPLMEKMDYQVFWDAGYFDDQPRSTGSGNKSAGSRIYSSYTVYPLSCYI